jgi:hypothetical protein
MTVFLRAITIASRLASPNGAANTVCFALLLLAGASSCHLSAQTKVPGDGNAPASRSQEELRSLAKVPVASSFITVTPRRSRPQATPGDSFEIAADIQNISTKTLYFNPFYVTMTPPPELDPQAPRDWYGTFPGDGTNYCEGGIVPNCDEKSMKDAEQNRIDDFDRVLDNCYSTWRWKIFHRNLAEPRGKQDPLANRDCSEIQVLKDRIANRRNFDKVVELAPGSTTTVFWNGHTRTGQNSLWSNAIAELVLPPGPYSVTIVADFWETRSGAEEKSLDHQSYSTVLAIPIVASQLTIIIGSVLGGLIAFFLLPTTRFFETPYHEGKSTRDKVTERFFSLMASVMLSVILTILLSRLADSEFIIKVTVNDFWGAIAIGFIASASGKSILSKIAGTTPGAPPQQQPATGV